MKKTILIIFLLVCCSTFAQTHLWKPFESPARSSEIRINRWGNKLILSNIVKDSAGTKDILNTYIWDGNKWDSILPLEGYFGFFRNDDVKLIIYKNQICYSKVSFISGSDFTNVSNSSNLVIWDGTKWEGKSNNSFKQVHDITVAADSNFLYMASSGPGASKSHLAILRDTGWEELAIPTGLLYNSNSIKLFKNQLYISMQNPENNILRYTGSGFDTLHTNDSRSANGGFYIIDSNLYFVSFEVYIKKNDTFMVTNSDDMDALRISFGGTNNIFSYKDKVFGLNVISNSDLERYNAKYDGVKWRQESDFFNFINSESGVFVDGNKIIGAAVYDSVFTDSIKPTQYLAYVENLSKVKGKVYNDIDSNCKYTSNDLPSQGAILYCESIGNIYSDMDGNTENYLPAGQYVFKKTSNPNYRYWKAPSCQSDSIIINVSDSSNNDSIYFALKKRPNIPDLTSYMNAYRGTTAARGFNETYSISCKNMGSINSPAQLYMFFPNNLPDKNFTIKPDTLKNNYACWLFNNLKPDSQININMTATFDTTYFNVGDSIYFTTLVLPEVNDSFVDDNRDTLKQFIVASHDPNFKSAMPGDSSGNGIITPEATQLNYTIHFENTGNDTAFNVRVVDYIDTSLNSYSVLTTSASDEYALSICKGALIWNFYHINLPPKDSFNLKNHANEGFINYRISLAKKQPIGTVIYNSASIYFDYNYGVFTNTATVLIDTSTKSIPNSIPIQTNISDLKIYPNPGNELLILENENASISKLILYDISGRLVLTSSINKGKTIVNTQFLNLGLYIISIIDKDGKCSFAKWVKE